MRADLTFFGLLPPMVHWSDSTITNDADKEKLAILLPNLEETTLLYRASRDGWSAQAFHSKVNGHPHTVSIIKVGTSVFGGYTPIAWASAGGYKYDPQTFLFSLQNPSKLFEGLRIPNTGPSAGTTYSIYDHSSYCCGFGGGHDLMIYNDANKNLNSYSNLGHSFKHPAYSSGTTDANNFFCGSANFSPTEVEVFTVSLSD